MIKRVVILPDVHLDTTVPKAYRAVKNFLVEDKPDMIIILGDFMDVSALSAWDMDKRKLMEGRRYNKEVEIANQELDFLQENCNEIVYLFGNHETRVERYIEKFPEMEGILEVDKVLNLEKRGIKWIDYNKLYRLGKLYLTHGMYTNKYHANKHLTSIGGNVVYGHTHKCQSEMMSMHLQQPIMAWGLGCLCSKSPDYLRGKPSNWINGFAYVYFHPKNGEFNLYPINIIGNKFIWKGKIHGLIDRKNKKKAK